MSNIKSPQSARPRNWFFGPAYTGAELAPYAGRPGAMYAYGLPSLHLGRLVWPKGHQPQQTDRKA